MLYKCCDWFEHWMPCSTRWKYGTGMHTLLLRLIPGDLYSSCPYRQIYSLPGLEHSEAALQNYKPNACMPSRETVCTIYWWSLIWPCQGVNPWPPAWEADTLTTKPSRSKVALWSIWLQLTMNRRSSNKLLIKIWMLRISEIIQSFFFVPFDQT